MLHFPFIDAHSLEHLEHSLEHSVEHFYKWI